MTFILTFVCLTPSRRLCDVFPPLIIERVEAQPMTPQYAGYVPALARYIGKLPAWDAYYVLVDEGKGYRSSNLFFEYGDDDDPARLVVPSPLEAPLRAFLESVLWNSTDGQVLVIAEDNGHVTDPALTDAEAESIEVIGPIDTAGFWRLVELGEIYEDSLVVIQEASTSHV